MKIRRDTGRKSRIDYGFFGMTSDGPNRWWYNRDLRMWERDPKHGEHDYATWRYCHSVRAFRRMLKDAPVGIGFKLESVWKGRDAHGIGSGQPERQTLTGSTRKGPTSAPVIFKSTGEGFEHFETNNKNK